MMLDALYEDNWPPPSRQWACLLGEIKVAVRREQQQVDAAEEERHWQGMVCIALPCPG